MKTFILCYVFAQKKKKNAVSSSSEVLTFYFEGASPRSAVCQSVCECCVVDTPASSSFYRSRQLMNIHVIFERELLETMTRYTSEIFKVRQTGALKHNLTT